MRPPLSPHWCNMQRDFPSKTELTVLAILGWCLAFFALGLFIGVIL
jgi:hypothetical protein